MPKVARGLSGILLMAVSLVCAAPSLTTSVAIAADLASIYYGGSAPYFAFSWARTDVGATLGYEWGGNNPARPYGVAGEFEPGFNRQNGSFVYGSEADIGFSASDDTFAPWQFSNPWFGTTRGHVGGSITNMLLFGAGSAYGELTGTTSGNLSESYAGFGWAAGLSAEASFVQHGAKAEWLYLDLVDRHFSETAANKGLAANLMRLGLNDHF